MKKIFILLLALILLTGCGEVTDMTVGLSEHPGEGIPLYTEDDSILSRYDYPLLDVAFTDGASWAVIIQTDLWNEGGETVFLSQNAAELSLVQEYIRVLTFPVGRGTTPEGCLSIYKEKELIKEVPFINIEFADASIRELFYKTTREDIEKTLEITLSTPI